MCVCGHQQYYYHCLSLLMPSVVIPKVYVHENNYSTFIW